MQIWLPFMIKDTDAYSLDECVTVFDHPPKPGSGDERDFYWAEVSWPGTFSEAIAEYHPLSDGARPVARWKILDTDEIVSTNRNRLPAMISEHARAHAEILATYAALQGTSHAEAALYRAQHAAIFDIQGVLPVQNADRGLVRRFVTFLTRGLI